MKNSIGYNVRVINPGDELSLVHEIWWVETPTRYVIPKGQSLTYLELIETAYINDPAVTPCMADSNIYHTKIEGNDRGKRSI